MAKEVLAIILGFADAVLALPAPGSLTVAGRALPLSATKGTRPQVVPIEGVAMRARRLRRIPGGRVLVKTNVLTLGEWLKVRRIHARRSLAAVMKDGARRDRPDHPLEHHAMGASRSPRGNADDPVPKLIGGAPEEPAGFAFEVVAEFDSLKDSLEGIRHAALTAGTTTGTSGLRLVQDVQIPSGTLENSGTWRRHLSCRRSPVPNECPIGERSSAAPPDARLSGGAPIAHHSRANARVLLPGGKGRRGEFAGARFDYRDYARNRRAMLSARSDIANLPTTQFAMRTRSERPRASIESTDVKNSMIGEPLSARPGYGMAMK